MDFAAMRLNSDRFSLVPGPEDFDEPFFSTDLAHVARYPATRVARVFESIGAQKVAGTGDNWFTYAWQWAQRDSSIRLGFSSMEGEYGSLIWGGSPLHLDCTAADLLNLWESIRATLPAVWLHDDKSRMYKPGSFDRALTG